MKERSLYILSVLGVFVLSFVIMKSFDQQSYASLDTATVTPIIAEGTTFKFDSKTNLNNYTTNTCNWGESQTYSIKKISATVNGSELTKHTYCAQECKHIGNIGETLVKVAPASKITSQATLDQLNKTMPKMYPWYSVENIKEYYKSVKGQTSYDNYKMGNLSKDEAAMSAQAAIWYILERNEVSYAGNHSTSSNKTEVKNRINELIKFYKTSSNFIDTPAPSVSVSERSYADKADGTRDVIVKIVANRPYETINVKFKDKQGNVLCDAVTSTNGTYVCNINPSNYPDKNNINLVYFDVNMYNTGQTVAYFYRQKNQDFIGLDENNYSETFSVPYTEATPVTGAIMIYKLENDPNINVKTSTVTNTTFTSSMCNGSCLAHVHFDIYTKKDGDSMLLYKSLETNDQGFAYVDNLPLGTYYVKEGEGLDGYDFYDYTTKHKTDDGYYNIDSDGYIEVIIDKNGDNGRYLALQVNNDLLKLCVKKVDSGDSSKTLNAKFWLEDSAEGNDDSDEPVYYGSVYEEFTTLTSDEIANGEYCLTSLDANNKESSSLVPGTYCLSEQSAPSGYTRPSLTTKYCFQLGKNEYNKSGDKTFSRQFVGGQYVVVNTNLPFSETNSNNKYVVTVKNSKGASITKSDAVTGECVAGAVIDIKDSSGNIVDSWKSECNNGNDVHEIKYCTDGNMADCTESITNHPGTYELCETLAPFGYSSKMEVSSNCQEGDKNCESTALAPNCITFSIDSNGKTPGLMEMKDDPINVCFEKTNEDGKLIAGAKMEVYDSNGNKVAAFTSDTTPTCFNNQEFDKGLEYIVKEKEAPKGYKISEDKTIKVEDTPLAQTFKVVDELVVPATSVTTSTILTIVSIIFALFGITMVSYYGYKKTH